jgi:hypothetical protein
MRFETIEFEIRRQAAAEFPESRYQLGAGWCLLDLHSACADNMNVDGVALL